MLLGVHKQLLQHMLRARAKVGQQRHILSREQRRLLRERGRDVGVTSDFGRPYKCVVQHVNSYSMEDHFHFLETFSFIVFRDGFWGEETELQEVYETFRTAALHYLRAGDDKVEYTEAAVDAAATCMRKVGELLETYGFPKKFMSYNLHMLCCRLHKQERNCGRTAYCWELWCERLVQHVKSMVRGRTSTCPEKVAAHQLLLRDALDAVNRANDGNLKSFDDLVPRYRLANRAEDPLWYDSPDDANTALLDKGWRAHLRDVPIRRTHREALNAAVDEAQTCRTRHFFRKLAPAGWGQAEGLSYAVQQGNYLLFSGIHNNAIVTFICLCMKRNKAYVPMPLFANVWVQKYINYNQYNPFPFFPQTSYSCCLLLTTFN